MTSGQADQRRCSLSVSRLSCYGDKFSKSHNNTTKDVLLNLKGFSSRES